MHDPFSRFRKFEQELAHFSRLTWGKAPMRTRRPIAGLHSMGVYLCRAESASERFLAALSDNATRHVLNVLNYGKTCRLQFLVASSQYYLPLYAKLYQRYIRTARRDKLSVLAQLTKGRECEKNITTKGGGSPQKSEKPQITWGFWGLYYTVIRRDPLSTV